MKIADNLAKIDNFFGANNARNLLPVDHLNRNFHSTNVTKRSGKPNGEMSL